MLLACSVSCYFCIYRLIQTVSSGKIFESGLCLIAVLYLRKSQEPPVARLTQAENWMPMLFLWDTEHSQQIQTRKNIGDRVRSLIMLLTSYYESHSLSHNFLTCKG